MTKKIFLIGILTVCVLNFEVYQFHLKQNIIQAQTKNSKIEEKQVSIEQKDVLKIVYPLNESKLDTGNRYQWEVLAAALKETIDEGEYELVPSSIEMAEERKITEVSKPSGLLTILRQTNLKGLNNKLLPIPIPLLKGALGWRVFLIINDLQPELDKTVNSSEDLKKYSIGSGRGWADKPVLLANGFDVVVGHSYEGLFFMLMRDRFKLLPRGLNECLNEINERKDIHPYMALEKNLILRYELYEYFWVNKNNTELASRIERGLKKLIVNGGLDKLFDKHFENDMLPPGLNGRTIIDVDSKESTLTIKKHPKEQLMERYLRKKGIVFEHAN